VGRRWTQVYLRGNKRAIRVSPSCPAAWGVCVCCAAEGERKRSTAKRMAATHRRGQGQRPRQREGEGKARPPGGRREGKGGQQGRTAIGLPAASLLPCSAGLLSFVCLCALGPESPLPWRLGLKDEQGAGRSEEEHWAALRWGLSGRTSPSARECSAPPSGPAQSQLLTSFDSSGRLTQSLMALWSPRSLSFRTPPPPFISCCCLPP
jgi:hypothetical protein